MGLQEPSIVNAWTSSGLFKTTEGGTTWNAASGLSPGAGPIGSLQVTCPADASCPSSNALSPAELAAVAFLGVGPDQCLFHACQTDLGALLSISAVFTGHKRLPSSNRPRGTRRVIAETLAARAGMGGGVRGCGLSSSLPARTIVRHNLSSALFDPEFVADGANRSSNTMFRGAEQVIAAPPCHVT